MKLRSIIVILFFWTSFLEAQGVIKTMFYNLLEFPEAPPTNRATILKTILDDYQPDLFMVCELESEEGANTILNTSLQTADNRYAKANFVSNQSNPTTDLQQLVFFNQKKLILESQDLINTGIRDINHYLFKLNTPDKATNPIYLDVFVAHLKSSQGFDNEQKRLDMVLDFTSYLVNIPSDHYVLISGDFNLYTDQEDAYYELLESTNAVVLKDPINKPGNWHNNSSFQDIHTQSSRDSNENFDGFGAGGGIDDRFDFILISENLENSITLKYTPNSYKAYGNNGNCYNKAVNDVSCTGVFSQTIRDALYNMSDHLPVVMQLETDKVLSSESQILTNNYLKFISGNFITDKISLKVDVSILDHEIVIYNSMGQQIKSVILNKQIENIDATNFANGIYYIKLQHTTSPLKFIKL
ncbi:T9SS type A sorting domain-containing protein [Aureibaculum sp. 2210JD6-5]|uniref:T9SS type A sorting domain-containing protein n=1 Tax=Aureibaculum sp. 2210JD6-5 TaxID=3103957 RepID=UPI002AAC7A1A|nr:T9SS type A sorting domain-containing protein [Aureibaculum sp. 2210JD6-5]MDY7395502.1 T9SS type A sorting domain-containing protein [Aureibaculum sp. 2210JD6-5]